ncbi:MAG: hypothetical protein HFF60_07700 [Oscillospiraceae bacterium]|nr:hypothetical protein [Oscillospiraceae bacterium]
MVNKIAIILVCMLACFSLFTGCTDQKDGNDQDTNLGNSVEIDDTDIAIDAEPGLDTEDNSDNVTLPDGFTYSFRDPDNADGIVVTPRE